MRAFRDGLSSLYNSLINNRVATNTNTFTQRRISRAELREIYKNGVANKIYRIKSGYALDDTLQFESEEDKAKYDLVLAPIVKTASLYQLAFGRGVILLNDGDDLASPLKSTLDIEDVLIEPFSADVISATSTNDINDKRFHKPIMYMIYGNQVHWSRVIDFSYVLPAVNDSANYMYGGISEAELIYDQLINDGVIQRAVPSMLEKSSTLFYKVKGLKQKLRMKQEAEMLTYFSQLEDNRSIYGAALLDEEDSVETVTQGLSGLRESDDVSLRRLALVTGIPVSMLVGENVKGLNASGESERDVFNDTIAAYQSNYLIRPINQLMLRFGMGNVSFLESATLSPAEEVAFETTVLQNATMLMNMGEDHTTYLETKGLVTKDTFDNFFTALPKSNSAAVEGEANENILP